MSSSMRRRVLGGGASLALLAALIAPPAAAQGLLSALDDDVQRIANSARSSVVTVLAERTVERRDHRSGKIRRRPHTRIGSGVALESDIIVTTSSIVQGAQKVWIQTTNDLKAEAEVLGDDPVYNVAVLRVTSVLLPILEMSKRPTPLAGEWVMAVGTAQHSMRVTESVGTVAHRYDSARLPLLQLTNIVYPGCSGGAVLNARGELIGIVQGEMKPTESPSGLAGQGAVVMPAGTLRPVFESLRDRGRVPHGYLGVTTRAATVESETVPGLTVPIGALVESVRPDGPADLAGLRRGDLLVGFERDRVEYPDQLARWVAASAPGSTVELVWVRDEIQHVGRAVLGQSPVRVPEWAMNDGAAGKAAGGANRIPDLERRTRGPSREMDRIRSSAERDSP